KRQKAPTINEVISAKKEALFAFIGEIAEEKDNQSYLDLAVSILSKYSPEVAISALLRHTHGDEFLPESYIQLAEPTTGSRNFNERSHGDRLDDQIKLFIAMGKTDGLNPRKLLELLNTQAKTPARKVRDIRILDNFSFITVPFDEAEFIMKAMNKEKSNRPLVTRAKK
ncbi:MAG: DbpA RNA binding domain-containing protein, partial [Burkholderiales bacterium]|nr:DbpA RNA binding domain-containing protein [Burkholderiales bacterium]